MISRYEELAKASRRSRNWLMAEALRAYLDREEQDRRRLTEGTAALDRDEWVDAEAAYEEHVALAERLGISRGEYEARVREDVREQIAALGLVPPADLCE